LTELLMVESEDVGNRSDRVAKLASTLRVLDLSDCDRLQQTIISEQTAERDQEQERKRLHDEKAREDAERKKESTRDGEDEGDEQRVKANSELQQEQPSHAPSENQDAKTNLKDTKMKTTEHLAMLIGVDLNKLESLSLCSWSIAALCPLFRKVLKSTSQTIAPNLEIRLCGSKEDVADTRSKPATLMFQLSSLWKSDEADAKLDLRDCEWLTELKSKKFVSWLCLDGCHKLETIDPVFARNLSYADLRGCYKLKPATWGGSNTDDKETGNEASGSSKKASSLKAKIMANAKLFPSVCTLFVGPGTKQENTADAEWVYRQDRQVGQSRQLRWVNDAPEGLVSLAECGLSSKLMYLDVSCCLELKTLPDDIENLVRLNCFLCEQLETLPSRCPKLMYLNLTNCTQVKKIPTDLTQLEQLIAPASGIETLRGSGLGPSLKQLDVRNCVKLKALVGNERSASEAPSTSSEEAKEPAVISPLRALSALPTLSLYSCSELECLGVYDLGDSLTAIEVERCYKLASVPDMHKLDRLDKVVLKNCSKLSMELMKLPTSVTSLEINLLSGAMTQITADGHGNWKSTVQPQPPGVARAVVVPPPPTAALLSPGIREISADAKKLVSLTLNSVKTLTTLPNALPCLEKLLLNNCEALEALPDMPKLVTAAVLGSGCLKTLDGLGSSLQLLNVENCGSLGQTAEGEESMRQSEGARSPCNLSGLRRLMVKNCTKLTSLDGWRLGASLTHLQVERCPEFTVLPSSLGQMKDLTDLVLHAVAIKELPDTLGQLSALTTLYLGRCLDLTTLPASVANLSKLSYMSLEGGTLKHAQKLPKLEGQHPFKAPSADKRALIISHIPPNESSQLYYVPPTQKGEAVHSVKKWVDSGFIEWSKDNVEGGEKPGEK